MAKIRDIQLPPALNQRLIRLVEDISDPVLESLVRGHLPGGFTKARAIRKRLAAMIEGSGPLPDWFLDMIQVPGRHALSSLSLSMIESLREPLHTLLGHEDYLLSLLMDEREEVRKLAHPDLSAPKTEPSPEASLEARQRIQRVLDLHLAEDLGLESIEKPGSEPLEAPMPVREEKRPLEEPEPAAWIEEKKRLAEEIRKRDRHLDNARKRLKAKKRELETRLREMEASWNEERRRLREHLESARKERDFFEREARNLKADQAAAIARGVEEETSSIKRPWLSEAQAVATEIAEGQSQAEDLLEQARQAVRHQAERDRHSGNRRQLQQRLQQLREAREEVHDTHQHALHPLPELLRIRDELDGEIERLSRLMGSGQREEAVLSRLLEQISGVGEMAQLRRLDQLIQELAEFGLLSRSDRQNLYQAIYKKFSLLEDQTQRSAREEESDGGWNLRSLIVRNQEALIYVDGHNLILSLEQPPGQREKEAVERDRFVARLDRMVSGKTNVETIVFFDGPRQQTESIRPNLRLEYSGGRGEHRADRRIAEELAFQARKNPARRMFVVSNDHEVRQNALRHGARFVPIEAFDALLPQS